MAELRCPGKKGWTPWTKYKSSVTPLEYIVGSIGERALSFSFFFFFFFFFYSSTGAFLSLSTIGIIRPDLKQLEGLYIASSKAYELFGDLEMAHYKRIPPHLYEGRNIRGSGGYRALPAQPGDWKKNSASPKYTR